MPQAKRPTSKPATPPPPKTEPKVVQCSTCGGKGVLTPLPRHNLGTAFADAMLDVLGVKGENRLMYAVTLDAIDVRLSAYDRKYLTDLFTKYLKEKK